MDSADEIPYLRYPTGRVGKAAATATESFVSVAAKTFGTLGAFLLVVFMYLSPFVLGWHFMLYPALAMTAVMLIVIMILGSGRG